MNRRRRGSAREKSEKSEGFNVNNPNEGGQERTSLPLQPGGLNICLLLIAYEKLKNTLIII
jgi:hypothetical protein